ncbi:MAG: hypothetical protein VX574_07920 [Myxococcota bacterium]|nr:hypothetical protein [Myxococcota bacterium]
MSPRTSLGLVVVALLLGAVVFFVEGPSEDEVLPGKDRIFSGLPEDP